ncbi:MULTISPECIES: AMP-binding protein [unclassified Roseitalea]|uniref:AMP-binding protein n=1 Tax=unclassified Roseitalea TaxID=2639107 RepID=UPI00273E4FB2|nr:MULTISPECIES: AMP-binding protein [unclassified Roseitalea]
MAAKRAELTPDAAALVDARNGRCWTFSEVNHAANAIAHGLARLGLSRGDRLAVLCLNRVEFFVTLFACQKAGVIMAPLNWRQPVAELAQVAQGVGVAALAFDDDHRDTGRALAERLGAMPIAMDDPQAGEAGLSALMQSDGPPLSDRIDASAPWYVLFTSGTTGLPKAVIQTPRMSWANALNIAQAIDLTARDTSVNFLPLFHTGGINLYTLPLFLFGGASTVVPRFEPDTILDLIAQGAVTQFFGVPAIFQAFSLHGRVGEIDWASIRMACGGAPLPEHLIGFFAERGALICNGFGMTETGPTAFLMDPAHVRAKIGSVGKAQMLTQVRLDAVAEGEPGEGELQLRGPAITPGYFGDAEATARALTADGWLRSGDVARRDSDGYYYIVDRIKDMYISGGENVYPAEVERVLNTHEAIVEAAVVGVPDARWGEIGAAFLIVRPGRSLDVTTLDAWCRERLAAYKVPGSFRILDDFPRTAAGKVRKPTLRALLQ